MNSTTVKIAIEVDDKGSIKIRQVGKEASAAGEAGAKGFDRMAQSAKRVQDQSSLMTSTMKSLGAVIATAITVEAVRRLVAIADAYTRVEGRIKLVTASARESVAVQNELYAVAQRSRAGYIATAEVYARFAQALQGQHMAQSELIGMTETLNKAFVISGASAAEQTATMVQLSQAFSSGVLRGEEFNSVAEQGSRIMTLLTDYTGKSRGELRAMAEQGQLTADVLRDAIAAGAAKVNAEFDQMPVTVEQASTQLANAWQRVMDGSNDATGATKGLAAAIQYVAEVVEQLPSFVAWAVGEIMVAWDGVTRFFEESAATIRNAFAVSFDEITEIVADKMRWITDTASAFTGVDLSQYSDLYAKDVRGMSTATEEFNKELTGIAASHERSVAGLRETQRAMVIGSAATVDLTKKTGTLQTTVKKTGSEHKTTAGAAKNTAKEYQSLLDRLLPLEKEQREYNEALAALDKLDPTHQTERYKTALDNLNKSLTANKKLEQYRTTIISQQADYEKQAEQASMTDTEVRIDNITRQIYALEEYGQRLVGLGLATQEMVDANNAAFGEQARREIGEMTAGADEMGKMFEDVAKNIQSSFAGMFEEIFTDGISSFDNIGKSILRMFQKILAQMATMAIAQPIIVPVVQAVGQTMGVSNSGIAKALGIEESQLPGGDSLTEGVLKKGMEWFSSSGSTAASSAYSGAADAALGIYSGNAVSGMSSSGLGAYSVDAVYGVDAYSGAASEFANSTIEATSATQTGASAMGAWSAGVLTLVSSLLAGEKIVTSAAKGLGAAGGMYAGSAAGTAIYPGIGTAIGGALGAIAGALGAGKLFEKDPPHMGIDQGVQNNVDSTFDQTNGFDPTRTFYDPNYNETAKWVHPVFNAYSESIAIIQESFDQQVFELAKGLPEKMKEQMLGELAGQDFKSLLSSASAGVWEGDQVEEGLKGIAKKYVDGLSNSLGNAYANALASFIATEGPAGFFGEGTVWGLLTEATQASVTAAFHGAARQISSGDIDGGIAKVNGISQAITAIGQAMAPITEILETDGLSEYALQVRAINRQFDAYKAQLQSVGVDMEKYTDLEKAREIDLRKAAAAVGTFRHVLEELAQTADNSLSNAADNLRNAFAVEQDRLAERHGAILAGLNGQLEIAQKAVSSLTAITGSLRSALQRMKLESDAFVRDRRVAAQATLQATLAAARRGELDPSVDLGDTLSTLTQSSTGLFATFEDYQRDFWTTYLAVAELEQISGDQLSESERTVDLLERQIDAENRWYQTETDLLIQQLNAILGLNTAILSISTATTQYQQAQAAQQAAQTQVAAASSGSGISEASYFAEKVAQLTAIGVMGTVYDGVLLNTVEDVKQVFANQGFTARSHYEQWGQYEGLDKPSFAVGTDYVPHDMTANIHKGERIVPAAYNRADSTNAELLSELRALRVELSAQGRATATNTSRMEKHMSRWEGDGLLVRSDT